MSKATNAFKMSDNLSALRAIGDVFGIGDELVEQVEKKVDTFAEAGKNWALATHLDWYQSAPWATGNLRNAIESDTSNPSNPKVFVNHRKLMAHAGAYLPYIRKGYLATGKKRKKMPDYDYLEEAEETAASAATSIYPITPLSEREYASGVGSSPFLYSIWVELAKKNRKVYLNGR